jgi:hypothetical protein
MHRFRERSWAIVSLGLASKLVTGTELAALVGTSPTLGAKTRGDPVSRVNTRPRERSSVTYHGSVRFRHGTAEEQLATVAPLLEAIARIPPDRRPADLEVWVVVHLSVLTNAATISPELLALLHAAGAELEFWTDQAGRDRRRNRGGGY